MAEPAAHSGIVPRVGFGVAGRANRVAYRRPVGRKLAWSDLTLAAAIALAADRAAAPAAALARRPLH